MRYRRIAALLIALFCIAGAVFSQQALRQARIPADVEIIRDVEFGKGGDVSLKLDIVRPKTQPKSIMPVVVFIHGGGWQKGDKQSGIGKIILLAQKGYFCATINYRLTDVAPFPAQIEDCKCAIRWVRAHAKEYNADPDHIGVWGGSAGGHLVALLGTSGGIKSLEGKGGWAKFSSKVQAVADYFGPTDFLYWLEEMKAKGYSIEQLESQYTPDLTKLFGGKFSEKMDVAKQASPVTYITKGDPPVFIGHGEDDLLVPLSQSQVFYDALKAKGIEATLHIVKGQGHGFKDPETDRMVADFFDKRLKPAAAAKEVVIPPDIELIKDIPYCLDGHKLHKLDILRLKTRPKKPMPVIVWIHGGGFRGGSKTSGYQRLERFVRRGYLGVTIDYRFTSEIIFPAQLQDCKCAIRFLRAHAGKYRLDPKHIGVWGGSAGGNLVAMLGTTGGVKEFEGNGGWQKYSSRVQAVVDYYGMTDFLAIEELVKQGKATERFMLHDGKDSASGLLGGKFWENPDLCRKASPTTYASKDDPPFYIFHGDQDPLTNWSQSELLNKVLRKAGVESDFYLVKGGKHGWPPRADVDEKVDKFFDKHLGMTGD